MSEELGSIAKGIIEDLTSYGHCVPGTAQSILVRTRIVSHLMECGWDVETREFEGEVPGMGEDFGYNIHATHPDFNQYSQKIVFATHYDTRFKADEDPDYNPLSSAAFPPVPGANDGASGPAVLLTLADSISANPELYRYNFEFIFFDFEDQGVKGIPDDKWCVGSKFYAIGEEKKDHSDVVGIYLYMVGGKNTYFKREYFSIASTFNTLVNKIWEIAGELGYGDIFLNENIDKIISDNQFMCMLYPTVTIVGQKKTKGFPDTWHTLEDTIKYIDTKRLHAVAHTLLVWLQKAEKV